MKTLLETHDCYLKSEYIPIEKCKKDEQVMHQNKVESITIFFDKYDYNGVYIGTEKVYIYETLLTEIRQKIEEIEQDKKMMSCINNLPF